MLEGEKALRAEAARRLADLQRQAAMGRAGRPAGDLAAAAAALEAQVQQHSTQVRRSLLLRTLGCLAAGLCAVEGETRVCRPGLQAG